MTFENFVIVFIIIIIIITIITIITIIIIIIIIITNSNWTMWSAIQGVIAQVISKSASRFALGRFEIMSTFLWIITVCSDFEVEPVLQDISAEQLSRGANLARDARLDIHARGFSERQRSAFFNVRVCHPNAESYRDLKPQQIYRMNENEKKLQYSSRVLDVEHGTFTPLVFTTTGGKDQECLR